MNAPNFRDKKYVDREDLQWLSDVLDGGMIEGHGVEKLGTKILINKPIDDKPIDARVWLVTTVGSASGYDTDGPRCDTSVRRYAFQHLDAEECGGWIDREPGGIEGDGDKVVAFERNNFKVRNDTVQQLWLRMKWLDISEWPPVLVEEWKFSAGDGTTVPSSAGTASGSGSDSLGDDTCAAGGGLPANVCDADGNPIPACLKIVNADGEPVQDFGLAAFDVDGNIIAGGPPTGG